MNRYQEITNQIVSSIEKGGYLPWRKPWSVDAGFSLARNIISNKRYRGINQVLLSCSKYEDPRWATFNQVRGLGGKVKKGEKGTSICLYNFAQTQTQPDELGTETQIITQPYLKFFTVFNAEQCEIPHLKPLPQPLNHDVDLQRGLGFVAQMPNKPDVRTGGTRAFYSPTEDYVGMPELDRFESVSMYLSTLYHEFAHSTGHLSRLGRFKPNSILLFGSQDYAFEELVAELASTFLCQEIGIKNSLENHVAYLDNWLERFKADTRYIFRASFKAQRAVDFILNRMEQPCLF